MKTLPCAATLAVVAMLGGCATPSLSQLQQDSQALRAARSTTELTPAPAAPPVALGADGAARMALLRHPATTALLAQLQVAQADLYEALRPGNPSLDLSRLGAPDGVVHLAWSVSQPLLDLLFTGYRRRHGELAMQEARSAVADGLLRIERDARQAWLAHAAAAQRLEVARQAESVAVLAAELAMRFHAAGNITELQTRMEQAAASEAALERSVCEAAWLATRNALFDALGVAHHEPGVEIDTRLPLPMAFAPETAALETTALEERLDLRAQRAALEQAQLALGHQRRWRWLPGASVRYERERTSGGPVRQGPGIDLMLPLPDTGYGRVTRAEAALHARQALLAQKEVALRNRIAADTAALLLARQAVEVDAAALRAANRRIVELAGQQYNFMLIGSFELLAARQRQIEGELQYIDAVERWWQAFNDLAYEAGGRLAAGPVTGYLFEEELQ